MNGRSFVRDGADERARCIVRFYGIRHHYRLPRSAHNWVPKRVDQNAPGRTRNLFDPQPSNNRSQKGKGKRNKMLKRQKTCCQAHPSCQRLDTRDSREEEKELFFFFTNNFLLSKEKKEKVLSTPQQHPGDWTNLTSQTQ